MTKITNENKSMFGYAISAVAVDMSGESTLSLATTRVEELLGRISAANRPEIFLHVRESGELIAEMAFSLAAGGPLAGMTLAVKNNVDVAGIPTTAACPGFSYLPEKDAAAVAGLRAAGAVVIGVTNLDQFATGLVGTRSPYGAVRGAWRPSHISGGSSSGSAVAVALGLCDIAVGTDTAGSGRIPAALNAIVGIKATVGVVSNEGVVPACESYDCVTMFARDIAMASAAMAVMAAAPGSDKRAWPADVPLAPQTGAILAIPSELPQMATGWASAFHKTVDRARALGYRIEPIDMTPHFAAAKLLYSGALVAERYEAVGEFIDGVSEMSGASVDSTAGLTALEAAISDSSDAASDKARANYADRAGIDPVVEDIIGAAKSISAAELLRDRRKVERLRCSAMAALDEMGAQALLLPTAPFHPTLAEVAADPVGTNSRMGTYTNFCNLFDMCAVAVPAGTVDENERGVAQWGITVMGRSFADAVVAGIAADLTDSLPATSATESSGSKVVDTHTLRPWPIQAGAEVTDLVVFGAHRRGGPLEHELTSRGAIWAGEVFTSPDYRLFRLDSKPPKPGVVRSADGVRISGELWTLSIGALGSFLEALPRPMALGTVTLEDGAEVTGFGCEHEAIVGAEDISAAGRWNL